MPSTERRSPPAAPALPPDTRLYLARHGQSTWNAERRWAGHADPPLTSKGREQALGACAGLAALRFTAVTSSTLTRARDTARIIAETLDLPLLEPVSSLDERHAGAFCGLTWDEILERFPHVSDQVAQAQPIEIPDGEPWPAFSARVLAGLEAVSLAAHGRALVIAHAGVLRAITERRGDPPRLFRNLAGCWV